MKKPIYITTKSPNLVSKVAKIVVSVALIGLALMFSALLLIIIVTVGVIAWGYLWWRTCDLRRQMRKHPPSDIVIEGEVIEGKVIEGEVIEGEVIEGEVIRREVNGISVKSETDEIGKFIQSRNT